MGVCACRNRSKAAPTAEDIRAARLRRLDSGAAVRGQLDSGKSDNTDGFGTSPVASAEHGAPPLQVGDEKADAGKAVTAAAPASPSAGLRRRGGDAVAPANTPQASLQHIAGSRTESNLGSTGSQASNAGSPSSQEETISARAARVMKPLVKDAEYQTIEHVLRIVRNVLSQPKTKCFRSLNLASLQLQPNELDRARVALTAVGFVETQADLIMTLVDSVDLALAREVVRKLENTRCVWRPADIDRRAKEDAKLGEVMNATCCSKQHALEALAAAGFDTVFAVRLVGDGPKDMGGKPVQHPAYILNIAFRDELLVRKIWSSEHAVLPEYIKAAQTVCLTRNWVTSTKLGRILASVNAEIKEPKLLLRMEDNNYFEELLCKIIMKAYELTEIDLVRQQTSPPCGMGDKPCNIFDTLCHFAFFGPDRILGGGSPLPLKYLTWSLQTLLQLAEPNAIEMKVYEMCDVAHRCGSARKQTFYGLVSYCCSLKTATNPKERSAKTPHEEALIRFEECVEDFIDDHKAQAFASAFLAPARYYLHSTDRKHGAENLSVHGSNWYITLVHATLGMELPLSGHYDDHIIRHSSTVDFWPGLTPGAWDFFSKPENFGKYSTAIPRLPDDVSFIENEELPAGELPKGYDPGPKAMCLGNLAVHPGHDHSDMRKGLAIYLERFAHFFRPDFFVRKAFETLNAESKPEHMGFRRAAETLYSRYRADVLHGSGSDSLLEHVYDEYCTQVDVPRVAGFFTWLGVIKNDEQVGADSDSSDLFS